jgi:hypothetical protein
MRTSRIAAAAVVAATVVAGTPAQAAPAPGPTLLVPAVQAVQSGQPTWVKAYWGTTRTICDAKVTVRVGSSTVEYPANTDTYTSFYREDILAAGAVDYTAFRVTTAAGHTMLRAMRLTMAYRISSAYVGCSGTVLTRTFYATLPVREA